MVGFAITESGVLGFSASGVATLGGLANSEVSAENDTLFMQDSFGYSGKESCVSYSSSLAWRVRCWCGSPPDEDDEEPERCALNLSVGMHKCPEGAFWRGILV